MIISNDNEVIKNITNAYKCAVKYEGTVLLRPSQVHKYLGSIIKHKITNSGIIIDPEYELTVVAIECIDNIEWCLVIFNNNYYYTPKEYIDTKNFIFSDSTLSIKNASKKETALNSTIKVAKSPNTLTSNNEDKTGAARLELYTSEYSNSKFLVGSVMFGTVNVYGSPDKTSKIVRTLSSGEEFIVQSKWINYSEKSGQNIYLGTSTFADGGEYVATSTGNISTIEVTTNKPRYYSIIYDEKVNCILHGRSYGTLVRGDTTWPVFQNWSTGVHVNPGFNQVKENGILNYTYPANCAAPLADSSDMINKEFLGTLKLKNDCVTFDMHRISNYKGKSQKDCYLKNISVSAANSCTVVKYAIDAGFDTRSSPAGLYDNVYIARSGSSYIVTNYVTIWGKKCYICFKPTKDMNGAVNYIIIVDGGVENIDYNKYPPLSVDTSDSITTPSMEYTYVGDYEAEEVKTYDGVDHTFKHMNTIESADGKEPYGVRIGAEDNGWNPPYLQKDGPTVPPDYNGWPILHDAENYNLDYEMPYDTTHLYKINRFKMGNTTNGLSTKSFIFVTRPDLALYKQDPDTLAIDGWNMNPGLKRLPTFKYLARLKGTPESPGIGNAIMNSLCYWSTGSVQQGVDTPWLTVMCNQARGYDIQDRELDTVEMGETFHGNKVIYAEPTFKHKIAGTVSIPFQERRDLTLYHTLRMWIEYIQAVSMGYCEPYHSHKFNYELDYAVSLFYIQTDETMENILYWEKLTGLIPLTVPDSFFEWNEGRPEKDMNYTINFAYSFRTVMDELHLAEINNLYNKYAATNPSNMPLVPKDNLLSGIKDPKFDQLFGRIAAYYHPETYDNENAFNNLMGDQAQLNKFYYGRGDYGAQDSVDYYQVSNGSATAPAKFLPNWITRLRMHGVPYVKGPFIEHDPNAQKYILRWV